MLPNPRGAINPLEKVVAAIPARTHWCASVAAMAIDSLTVRSLKIRLLLPPTLVLTVVVIGTLGYRWLWRDVDGTWIDALFMTVTTITTIGYGEIKPLTTAGRLFTIFLAFTGIGSLFYTLGVVMEYLVGVRLADPMGEAQNGASHRGAHGTCDRGGNGSRGPTGGPRAAPGRARFVVVDPSERGDGPRDRAPIPGAPGGRHRGRGVEGRASPGAGPDRHHGQRRHQRVRGPVRPGPRPRALHRRARRRRGRRDQARPRRRQPGGEPVRDGGHRLPT